jgi:hypothetical protein
MVFNIPYNNMSVISWRSVSFVEEIGVPGDNHRPSASHWRTLSQNVVLNSPRHERPLSAFRSTIYTKQKINIPLHYMCMLQFLLIRTYLLRSSFRQSVIFLDILLRTFLFGYIISNSGRCACHPLIGIIICYIGC